MTVGLDHIVLASPDAEATATQLGRQLGIAPTRGGGHPDWGTRNWLFILKGQMYVEVIGPDYTQRSPAGPRPFGIDDLSHSRVVTWAVRVDDIDAAVARLRQLGMHTAPVGAMARQLPSGDVIRWRLTRPLWRSAVDPQPFLIDWGESPHPASLPGGQDPLLSLSSLTLGHPDPDLLVGALSMLGLENVRVVQSKQRTIVAEIRSATGLHLLDSQDHLPSTGD